MRTIFLIGFMGSGKSTVGRLLAERLGVRFIDTDEEIAEKEGKSINEIFAEDGEAYFRELETALLTGLPESNAVVGTGGGVPLKEINRVVMKEKGIAVFLDAPADVILSRLIYDQSRPLLKGDKDKEIRERLSIRMPIYLEIADIRISTSGKTPEEIIGELIACFKERGMGHTC
ncbi:shikimate kinase [Neobacillus piezotolerans]|uniref:Shikimate kinase n=1 Tax=Neobacillus piezotolerans TaxID=2259171 RepID=A0A3D8GLH4_9BACI|nr:shikimate kinase [Neobacillus piezotolerans]RDU35201.1 shikimate kinase [Neobacillus piezotolerans]